MGSSITEIEFLCRRDKLLKQIPEVVSLHLTAWGGGFPQELANALVNDLLSAVEEQFPTERWPEVKVPIAESIRSLERLSDQLANKTNAEPVQAPEQGRH